jgi:ribose transport system permease protein
MIPETPRRLNFGFERYSGLYLWAGFIVVFGIWEPSLFLSVSTVHTIASQQSVAGLLAIAVLVPLVTGTYDLSVGAVANLSTIVVISLQTIDGWNPWESILVAIGVSAAIGIVNGFIVIKLRVSSFIATLGMATIVSAFQIIVSGDSQPVPPISTAWTNLTQVKFLGFQVIFFYLIVIAIFFWWVLNHTPAGRYLYAIGGNADAARLSGVKVGNWVWASLITSATLSGIAGVLFGSLSGPSLTYGQTLLLPAFAAVFLGSTQLKPGRFNLWGTLLAIFVLATGVIGLSYVTGVQWLNDMFSGVALIGAVSFAVWRQGRAGRRSREDESSGEDRRSEMPGELPVVVGESPE